MDIKKIASNWLGIQKGITLPKQAADAGQILYRFIGGVPVVWYAPNSETYLRDGFEGNHVVFTVADWCARKLASIPPILYDTKDKGAAKDYKWLRKEGSFENYQQALRIKNRAFTEIKDHKILDVLLNPNDLMPYEEFIYGWYIFKKFVGKSDIQGISTEYGLNSGKIQQLYLLPSNYIRAVSGGGLTIISHYEDIRNPNVKIPTEQILEIRNFSANYQAPGAQLSGMSVLQAASKLLRKTNDSLSAQTETLQNRGARDIVYVNPDKDMPLPDQVQMDAMNEGLRKRLKEAGNDGVVINSLPLGVIKIGASLSDMQVLESNKLDNAAWASLFHVDSRAILNDHTSSTKDNMQSAKFNSVVDGVLPESDALRNGLNRWLVEPYGENLYLDFDHTVLPEIQIQLRETAKEMNATGVFTSNEIREMWKYPSYSGLNGDKILVGTNKQILDEMDSALPNTENLGDYGDNNL